MLKLITNLVGPFLYALSYFFPKKKNLVAISEWQGNRFSDNSAAVFIASKSTDAFDFVWISNSFESYNAAKIHGKTQKRFSLQGIMTQLRAGIFIFSNGKDDFIREFVTKRSVTFNLWHGPPIKKIHFDNLESKGSDTRTKLRNLRDKILPYKSEIPDFILANNHYYASIMHRSFRPDKGVIICSLPRWELPKSPPITNKKYILYAPTFRDSDRSSIPIPDFELPKLSKILTEHDTELIIKTHPYCTYEEKRKFPNILTLTDKSISLYNSLVPHATLIVTDISSLLFDAKHYNIPYLIYFPDKAEYLLKCRHLAIPFIEIIDNIESSDLISSIGNFLADKPMGTIDHPFLSSPFDKSPGDVSLLETLKHIKF